MRSHLERTLSQEELVRALRNPAERERRDLWWVDPDGANAGEVAADVASALVTRGLPWFDRCSDLSTALAIVQAERDCFSKFVLAAHLAEQLGDTQLLRHYRGLAENEAVRIDVKPDPGAWFPVCAR
jgi:ribosomal protein L13